MLRLPALTLLLVATWPHWESRAQSGRVIDMETAKFVEPREPHAEEWSLEVTAQTPEELREAICSSQGSGLRQDRPWECGPAGEYAPRTLIKLTRRMELAGMRLPFITGFLKIVGQCGPSETEPCSINAVSEQCSQCPTPNEIEGSSQANICDACKEGDALMDITETRPFLLGPSAKLWLENLNVSGCRARGSGGCIAMSNGDNNVWAATSSTQGDALTYLNAKNVTISRGYAGGLGGGLSVGRGSLAVLERCSLENNFAKTDGQLVSGAQVTEAPSHDILVQNYGALIALDTVPESFLVKLVPIPFVSSSINIDFIYGFLYTYQTPPPAPPPPTSPPPLSPGSSAPDNAPPWPPYPPGSSWGLQPSQDQLPDFIDDSPGNDGALPMWAVLLFAGAGSFCVFLALVVFYYCCFNAKADEGADSLDEVESFEPSPMRFDGEPSIWDEKVAEDDPNKSLRGKIKSQQALEDKGLSLSGTHEGRNKAALLKPISSRGNKVSADWQDQQTENVAAHLAKAKAMVVSNALDPILFGVPGSRPETPAGSLPAPPGSISAGETDYQNYYSHRRPQLSNDTYRPSSPASHSSSRHQGDNTHHHGASNDHHNYLVRPGSAASSSSPLASKIAQHPLRPPSQPGSAAQWMPRPGTPAENAASVITNRPTTAPTTEISSAVQSWGFALQPAAAPAATSASRPGTASGGSGHSSLGTNRLRPQSHRDHHAAHRPGSSRLSRMAKNTNGQERGAWGA